MPAQFPPLPPGQGEPPNDAVIPPSTGAPSSGIPPVTDNSPMLKSQYCVGTGAANPNTVDHAAVADAVAGGGGGGDAVQKTGDTMTGTLNINAAEAIATTGNIRLTGRTNYLTFDTEMGPLAVATVDGSLGWNLNWNGQGMVKLVPNSSNGALQVVAKAVELSDINQNILGNLHWTAGGDLVITQTTGPNTGKSVNLTAGKWA